MTTPQHDQFPPAGPNGPAAPQYVVMQAPPPKKKKWPWIVGGIFLVMVLGCVGIFAALGTAANEVVETLDENAAGKNAVPGEMGKPARDGKFEFTVTKLDCSKSSVGKSVLAQKAQGTYCIVSLTVKNIGEEAQTFDGTSQKAYDAAGTQYSNDSAAELALAGDASTFLEQINPGNQVKGQLVYDVPKGTELTAIELHDSFLSGGVKIPLS
ncbi:DUF4352 domain-containing protein [Actinoplanes sp. NPDC024001]|uniref:DUF4352 domain-containing protein n=1 Tax=Actinoplanes sp. NPDC024001 TaxID=3154598 RepID=UPI0033E5A76C